MRAESIEQILLGPASATDRGRARRALRLGGWAWPTEPVSVESARALAGQPAPAAVVGQALAVSVSETRVSLWALGDHAAPALPLANDARAVWSDAALALPRSLPLLWRPVRDAGARAPVGRRIVSAPRDDRVREEPEPQLVGRSFGLPLALLLASRLFERLIPFRFAATGDVSASGHVRSVEGLELKLRILDAWAPQVRFVLVPRDQVEDADTICRDLRLEPLGVGSVAEALSRVFDGLHAELVAIGRHPDQRRFLVQAFFRLALDPHGAVSDWRPVRDAAALAAETWSDLEPEEKHCLAFSRGVTGRHAGLHEPLALPEAAWLSHRPQPIRLRVVAHVVQSSADHGAPTSERAVALAQAHIVRGLEATREHLQLQGALGRLLAATGRAEEALVLQQAAADGYVERLQYDEVSYPLTECYRLAGALEDMAAWSRAESMRETLLELGALDPHGEVFVDLHRARAQIGLGIDDDEAGATLDRFAVTHAAPAHARASALRWRVRLARRSGDAPGAHARILEIDAEDTAPAGNWREARILVDLDEAVFEGDAERCASLIASLLALEPVPQGLQNLWRAARGRPASADYLLRHYLY